MFQEGDSDSQKDNPIISRQTQKVHLLFNKPLQKKVILNLPNQKYDQRIGNIQFFKTQLDQGQVQIKQQNQTRRKQVIKREFPTLKGSFHGSKNPRKVFTFSFPYGRNVRRLSNDSKVHFLFQLGQQNQSALTIVDDYCDTSFDIIDPKNKQKQKRSLDDAVQLQKRLLDARRVNKKDLDVVNDKDFIAQGQQRQSDD